MAAYFDESDDEIGLDSHPIFSVLRENTEEQSNHSEPEELIAVQDSQIFIWDKANARVLTGNLKELYADDTALVQVSKLTFVFIFYRNKSESHNPFNRVIDTALHALRFGLNPRPTHLLSAYTAKLL